MSRTKIFIYNSLAQAFSQICLMASGVIVPRILLLAYGSEINGLVSSITQFIGYFNLVEAGISSAAIFALYKPLSNNDDVVIKSILNETSLLYRRSGLVFSALVGGLALLYPVFVKAGGVSYIGMVALIFILGINGALEFFSQGKYKVLLSADQRFYVLSISNIIYYCSNTTIVFLCSRLNMDVVYLKLVASLSLFLRFSVLSFYCRSRYEKKYFVWEYKKNKLSIPLINKRWDAMALQILGVVQTGAPIIILTLILGDLKLVSVYSVYAMIIGGVSGITGIFTSGLSSSFGDVIARNEMDVLKKSYRMFETSYYLIITVIYSALIILLIPFITLYTDGVSDVNYLLPLTAVLFASQAFFHSLKTPQGMLVLSAGLFRETRRQTVIQTVLLLSFGSVLTYLFGINGILVGGIISEIYRLVDLVIYIPNKVTHLSPLESWKRIGYNTIIFGLSCIISFRFKVQIYSYFNWCLWGVLVVIILIIIEFMILVLFDRNNLVNIMQKISLVLRNREQL